MVGKNCWFGWKGWLVGMLSPVLQIFLSVSGGLSGEEGKVGTDCPLSRTAPAPTTHCSGAQLPKLDHSAWRLDCGGGSGQGIDPIFILPFCPRFNFAGKCKSFLKLSSSTPCLPSTVLHWNTALPEILNNFCDDVLLAQLHIPKCASWCSWIERKMCAQTIQCAI